MYEVNKPIPYPNTGLDISSGHPALYTEGFENKLIIRLNEEYFRDIVTKIIFKHCDNDQEIIIEELIECLKDKFYK